MHPVALRTVGDALEALSRFTNYERTRARGPRDFDLSRPRRLLERLGSPHLQLGPRVIQVAGTKGKGSTARFLDGICRAAGLRTGRFTSPHLESVLERIAVGGIPIEEADFARRVEEVLEAVEAVKGWTTFFEALLAAACLHFVGAGCDAVILEVGLGGRLDATTVVPSTHTVITRISLEHTEILGTTLRAVAAEKAGTIRPGVPVWSGENPEKTAGAVIRSIALDRSAPFTYVAPPVQVEADASGLHVDGVRIEALGIHQAHNARLAAAACGDLPRRAVEVGLASVRQPGCCEVRPPSGGGPTVILDGAHTPPSVQATVAAVQAHFPGRRPVLVLAMAADKDLDAIAAVLAPAVGAVICTRADHHRGRNPEGLSAHPAWEGRAIVADTPQEALERARTQAGLGGLILVTGSLYLAGALRPLT